MCSQTSTWGGWPPGWGCSCCNPQFSLRCQSCHSQSTATSGLALLLQMEISSIIRRNWRPRLSAQQRGSLRELCLKLIYRLIFFSFTWCCFFPMAKETSWQLRIISSKHWGHVFLCKLQCVFFNAPGNSKVLARKAKS